MEFLMKLISGPQGLILLGGILTLIGALWSSSKDTDQERIINQKNQLIIDKTEEISELNSRTVDILTGGKSFPYVILSNSTGNPTIHIKGENAIQNVFGRVLDVRILRQTQREQGPINNYSGQPFKFDIVSPAYANTIQSSRINMNKSGRYIIHIYTPYSTYHQNIAVEIDSNGRPNQAYQVYKGTESELIFEYFPDNFPIPKEEIDFLEILPPEEFGPSK
jgi:hypothetical protein